MYFSIANSKNICTCIIFYFFYNVNIEKFVFDELRLHPNNPFFSSPHGNPGTIVCIVPSNEKCNELYPGIKKFAGMQKILTNFKFLTPYQENIRKKVV